MYVIWNPTWRQTLGEYERLDLASINVPALQLLGTESHASDSWLGLCHIPRHSYSKPWAAWWACVDTAKAWRVMAVRSNRLGLSVRADSLKKKRHWTSDLDRITTVLLLLTQDLLCGYITTTLLSASWWLVIYIEIKRRSASLSPLTGLSELEEIYIYFKPMQSWQSASTSSTHLVWTQQF